MMYNCTTNVTKMSGQMSHFLASPLQCILIRSHLSAYHCQLTASVSSCFQNQLKSRRKLLSVLLLQKSVYKILLPLASHNRGFSYPDTSIRIIDGSLFYLEQFQFHASLCRHIVIGTFSAYQKPLLPHPLKQTLFPRINSILPEEEEQQDVYRF